MKPEFKLGCHTCSAQLRGSREKNPLCWALVNHSSVLITMIPFKPLAKLPNKPPFVTWVSSKKQIKKKGLYQIAAQESVSSDLFNKASQPEGMPAGTGCISFFGDCISWFRFKWKERKKKQQTNTLNKIYIKRQENCQKPVIPKKLRDIYNGERKAKIELQWKLFLPEGKENTCVLFWHQTPGNLTPQKNPRFLEKLRSTQNSCQDCLGVNCGRWQAECTARMECSEAQGCRLSRHPSCQWSISRSESISCQVSYPTDHQH